MIKKYNFQNLISINDNINCIKIIDELFDSGNWCKTVPKYQTWSNLFEYDQFYKLKYSFIFSCFSYLEKDVDIIKIKSWCHMSYHFNQIQQNRDTHWHSHESANGKNLSGIFYLSNPKNIPNYELSGTEFKKFPNIIPEDFCWYIFPSDLIHRPGRILSIVKRYVIACNFEWKNK